MSDSPDSTHKPNNGNGHDRKKARPVRRFRNTRIRLEHQSVLIELWNRHLTMPEIQRKFEQKTGCKLSIRRIYEDIKMANATSEAEMREMGRAWFHRELRGLVDIEVKAMEEWERSRTDRERTRIKRDIGANGQPSVTGEAVQEKEGRLGDPRYLDIVIKCKQERARMLGLYAPLVLTGPGGSGLQTLEDRPAEPRHAQALIEELTSKVKLAHKLGTNGNGNGHHPGTPSVIDVEEAK